MENDMESTAVFTALGSEWLVGIEGWASHGGILGLL